MSMQSVHCNACGQKIEVPTTVRYVTCARCGASLVVRNEGGAWFTESPPAPGRAAQPDMAGPMREVAGRLEELERQSEIARLDREWEIERETYMMTGKYGSRSLPSTGTAIATGAVAVIGGGLWTVFTFSMMRSGPGPSDGPWSFFPCFGILFMLLGLGMGIYQYTRAAQYQEALERYQRRRRQMLDGESPREGAGF